jgi:hypothetical protein
MLVLTFRTSHHKPHVLIFGDLIPLHQLVILDVSVTHRAKSPLFNATATGPMQLIEMEILPSMAGLNTHRDGHETKGDMGSFQLMGHSFLLSGGLK